MMALQEIDYLIYLCNTGHLQEVCSVLANNLRDFFYCMSESLTLLLAAFCSFVSCLSSFILLMLSEDRAVEMQLHTTYKDQVHEL